MLKTKESTHSRLFPTETEDTSDSVKSAEEITLEEFFKTNEELRSNLVKQFRDLENNFSVKKTPEYENLVNFSNSYQYPIHRWFYYQEGYSPKLVQKILKEFESKMGNHILDPFCGGGTTLVVAAQNGMESIGFEVNPFSVYCSTVKTRDYSLFEVDEFRKQVNKIRTISFKPNIRPPQFKIIDKLFDENVLEKLLMYKEYILNVVPTADEVRDLLFFGWLSILEQVSNYRKGGNGLKKKSTKNGNKVSNQLISKYMDMLSDLGNVKQDGFKINRFSYIEPKVLNESALEMKTFLGDDSITASIFSPPYVNCFDYCEVYKIELWMGDFVHNYEELKRLRTKSIRSHVNGKWTTTRSVEIKTEPLKSILDFLESQKLWNKNIPDMIQGYFEDMEKVLENLHDVLVSGGKCAIVAGNSAYGKIVIPTDLLLSQIANEIGFRCKEIRIARRNETSSQQHKKLGGFKKYLRESVIIIEK